MACRLILTGPSVWTNLDKAKCLMSLSVFLSVIMVIINVTDTRFNASNQLSVSTGIADNVTMTTSRWRAWERFQRASLGSVNGRVDPNAFISLGVKATALTQKPPESFTQWAVQEAIYEGIVSVIRDHEHEGQYVQPGWYLRFRSSHLDYIYDTARNEAQHEDQNDYEQCSSNSDFFNVDVGLVSSQAGVGFSVLFGGFVNVHVTK